ncbi:MAG: cysteine--tRNA ligase, partial [Lachnoclostridium sp.]|nr:cysteine--tRNA ligase [Lachnoclostridium sp.]
LGETLDIHCGGIDSVFPHHTNEIAQSEAYLGHKWCNYWFHIHHLNDLSGKMSKSKGGFLTLSLLQEKGYDPIVYRFFCLQSHYRKPLVFSYEALDNTVNAYNKLIKKIQSLNANESQQLDSAAIAKAEGWFEEALGNDLNTSLGISVLYDVLKMDTNDKTKLTLITRFDHVLSLDLLKKEEKTNEESIDKEFTAYIDQRIRDRAAAKKAKDFAKADAIREELSQKGILIKDTREGTVWEFDG